MLKLDKTQKILSITLAAIILYGVFRNYVSNKTIEANHTILCGKVLSIHQHTGGSWMADYEFVINGINYKHGSVFCTYATNERFINGDSNIIVVVQKNNSKNNELIETRDDLIKYNIVKMDTIGLKCDVSIIQNII